MNTFLRLPKLTEQTLAEGVNFLSALDPDLGRIHAALGLPPLWAREPGFATLVHIILEQQVSLASAAAAYGKLKQACGEVTPLTYLSFNDEELKIIGFSRQKAAYCRGLASAILDGQLRLDDLDQLEDGPARTALISVRGIGPWTADIYLLMVLLRPDSWPSGDLALAVAMQETKNLPSRPAPQELDRLAEEWHPWRAVAARMLWQAYLAKRNQAG